MHPERYRVKGMEEKRVQHQEQQATMNSNQDSNGKHAIFEFNRNIKHLTLVQERRWRKMMKMTKDEGGQSKLHICNASHGEKGIKVDLIDKIRSWVVRVD